ncbi:hypothetical protein LTR62_006401 [Meristemomyces frigidus]|uniref:Uncharacterized protein n=1 Tax=Meristemomyces frigidus TaxID=1508187 RepID=A0AAN7TCU8_9PEZI|nr:hypothetical protein LTR62_006401 [Meristemomyces frigidus]
MADLSTRDDIEEELSFTTVLIGSLDQGAHDYASKLHELEQKQSDLEQRLAALPGSSRPQTSDGMDPGQQYGQHGYGWDAMTMGGNIGSSNGSYSHNRDLTSNHGVNGPFTSSANSIKRSLPHDLAVSKYHTRPSKRSTPEPSYASSGSSDSPEPFTETGPVRQRYDNSRYQQQVRQREEMLKRRREEEHMSEQLARSMSYSRSRPTSTMPSSTQSGVQTTISHNGMFQRPPPPRKTEDTYTLPPTNYQSSYQGAPASYLYNQAQPQLPKPGSSRQHLASRPHHSTTVVDLTGSDGESDGDLVEVGPSGFTPNHRPVKNEPTSATPQRYNIPGSYPTPYSNNYPPVTYVSAAYNPLRQSSTTYGRPMANLLSAQRGYMAPDFGQLNMLVNGTSSGPIDLDNDVDDDLVYGGTHPMVDAYANQVDLFRSRYDMIQDNDPTKTKEEINALLENIRPDEEMPQHLRIQTPEALNITLHKYQEMGLTWLRDSEDGNNKGGILADDMGLGKTIQMISLLVTNKSDDPRNKTTLIIAPVALLRQWKQEIESKVKSSLRHRLTVFIHHGQSKKKSFADLRMFDVVITTYGTLGTELKKLEKFELRRKMDPTAVPYPAERCSILGPDAHWYRVVLDEAQCIKNKGTQSAKAAYTINAKYRWCMSGTPMMNGVDEFFSLVRFLRVKPYSVWEKFRKDFSQPLKSGGEETRTQAMQRFQILCKAVMLRRTKKSKFEGKPILILPERTTDLVHPEFSEDERSFYTALETQTQATFNKYWQAGTVGKQYSQVLVLLLRLRQAACHPHLIRDYAISAVAGVQQSDLLKMAENLAPEVVQRIKDKNGSFECNICWDATTNPAIFIPCGHDACSECFAKITDPANAIANGQEETAAKGKCPNCRGPIDSKQITDFTSFKQVHQRELLTAEERKELKDGDKDDDENDDGGESNDEGDDVDDSDADSDDEESVKVDAKGNLDGFVVGDDVEDIDDDDDDSDAKQKMKVKDEESEDYDPEDLDNIMAGPSTANGSKPKTRKSKPTADKVKKSKKAKGKSKEQKKRKKIDKATTLADLRRLGSRNIAARKAYLRRLRHDYVGSAKIYKTMETLTEIMAVQEPENREKVLIFSQWTSLLDLLEIPIDQEGWGYRRYDGSMNARERADAVDEFKTSPTLRIMLVSLKAGNAGLNLNMASQVIILDPFWNPFIEEQAIDRAHRLGQQRPVRVHRMLIENTVEDRIRAIQEKKRTLIGEALDEKAGNSVSRLGMQELAYLFGVTGNPGAAVGMRAQGRR